MFDVGFSELMVIAIVALVVLGPERLPKAARLAGLWVRKARAQWYSVKAELERELAAEELKQHVGDAREVMRGLDASVRATHAALRADIEQAVSPNALASPEAEAPPVSDAAVADDASIGAGSTASDSATDGGTGSPPPHTEDRDDGVR